MLFSIYQLKLLSLVDLASSTLIFCTAHTQFSIDANRLTRFPPRELNIPTSPYFDMMGIVAPSQVARSTDIKDFKVYWSLKNWKLNPN